MVIRTLLMLYLAFAVFALVVAIWDPSNDPLAAVFLVIAAMPWTLAASWLMDQVASQPPWLGYVLLSLGVVLNALLLLTLSRWLDRRGRGTDAPG